MPTQPTEADEHLHEPPTVPASPMSPSAPAAPFSPASPAWTEAYGFEFATDDGRLGGFVVMTAHPLLGRSWCWAAVAGRDRAVCMVDEPEAPLPRRAGMELRAPALWVDVEIEIPFVHATVGMEAFGLVFDDPVEALRSGRGERIPFGLDLEWESDAGDPVALDVADADGYELACRVSGEVLLGPERHEIDAPGRRWHRWGSRSWWDEPPHGADGHVQARVVAPLPFPSVRTQAVQAVLDPLGWSITRHLDTGAAGMAR